MKLDNFDLVEYNHNDAEHNGVLIELGNDRDGSYYLGDLFQQAMVIERRKEEDYLHNYSYIAYYNDEAVGYISLTHKEERYEISYGIVPAHRGEYLGALLLQEFSEKLFEVFPDIDKLTLLINNLNTASKKTAKLAGYIQENSVRHTQRRI